ncbi:hypothetical protein MWG47_09290 [Escherichia coli]|nr:hypothetical protein [Escherichia coli]
MQQKGSAADRRATERGVTPEANKERKRTEKSAESRSDQRKSMERIAADEDRHSTGQGSYMAQGQGVETKIAQRKRAEGKQRHGLRRTKNGKQAKHYRDEEPTEKMQRAGENEEDVGRIKGTSKVKGQRGKKEREA